MIQFRAVGLSLGLLLAACAVLPAAPPLTPEQVRLLESARQQALDYTDHLPDFLCTQITQRTQSASDDAVNLFAGSRSGMRQSTSSVVSDRIVEQLTFVNRQENYKVVSVNDRPAPNADHLSLGGAISSGEFGTALRDLFSSSSHTVFSGYTSARLRGRRVSVFEYQVPREAGIVVFGTRPGENALVGYHGQIQIDAESGQVLHFTASLEFPAGFSVSQADRSIEYAPVALAANSYLLPIRSEVTMLSAGVKYVNSIEFRNYRKYTSDVTIRYGGDLLQSAAPGKTAEEPAPPAIAPPPTEFAASLAEAPAPQPVAETQPAVDSTPAALPQPEPQPATQAVAQPMPEPEGPRLRMDVSLVLVPVVVRNAAGQAVGNLNQQNFELYDNGKRQPIVSFTMEQAAPVVAPSAAPPTVSLPAAAPAQGPAQPRFLLYLFDDLHTGFAELNRVREAARHSLGTLQPTDLAALVTTSGLVEQNFTTDRDRLSKALDKLRAEPVGASTGRPCPNIDQYLAHRILTESESGLAMQISIEETFDCAHLDRSPATKEQMIALAKKIVTETARNLDNEGSQRNRTAALQIRDAVRWLGKAPGKRILLLASSGFFLDDQVRQESAALTDEAIRAEVVINSLDARGLYALPAAGAIEDPGINPTIAMQKSSFQRDSAQAASELMQDLAAGTGGFWMHDSNDLNGAMDQMAAQPAFTYLLGFKPAKADGRFHPLKLKLKSGEKLTLQARKGYLARKP